MENSIYLENQKLRINELRLKRRIEELEAKVKEQELAINYSQYCKSDSELLVCKGRCDHGYMDEFGNELFCSIKAKCAN